MESRRETCHKLHATIISPTAFRELSLHWLILPSHRDNHISEQIQSNLYSCKLVSNFNCVNAKRPEQKIQFDILWMGDEYGQWNRLEMRLATDESV